jgi:hypothetical protein
MTEVLFWTYVFLPLYLRFLQFPFSPLCDVNGDISPLNNCSFTMLCNPPPPSPPPPPTQQNLTQKCNYLQIWNRTTWALGIKQSLWLYPAALPFSPQSYQQASRSSNPLWANKRPTWCIIRMYLERASICLINNG